MLVYEHIEHPSRKGPVEVMFVEDELNQKYPHLSQYAAPLKAAERAIIGREELEDSIRSTLERPELCNVLLRGDAGSGKTAGVQLTMLNDSARLYLEVDPAKLVSNLANPNEMAARLKTLFDEAEVFVTTEKRELVLFIDEFHQIVQLSDAAVEALKPVLAASGVRGIRVIAATTNEEFHQFIAPNLPLMERFEIVIVEPPSNEVCVQILRGMAERYGVGDKFYNDHLFRNIVEYTNRYITASAQPRKSIKVLDAMVGRHNYTHKPMDRDMLADVLYRSTGINVVFNVDPRSIEKRLNERVYSQKAACDLLTRRLNICVADLHDKSRPRSSFLFVGSTGVGKSLPNDTPVPVYDPTGAAHVKRMDELVAGQDMVFTAQGTPTRVEGVFPQGEREVYRLTLADGRTQDADGEHLWPVYTATMRAVAREGHEVAPRLMTTQEMYAAQGDLFLPLNEAVQWPEATLDMSPYGMGCELAVAEHPHIPDAYRYASAEQRWSLLDGLLETTTHATFLDDYTEVFTTSSATFADELRDLSYSLGAIVHVSSTTNADNGVMEYHVCLQGLFDDTEFVEIATIEKLNTTTLMTCILVEDSRHLFQAGQFIVTHNTELTKGLSDILFGDGVGMSHFIRFDMAEYSKPEDAARLQSRLTRAVWENPFSVVLLDEIEKADETCIQLLLAMLDDGRMTDDNGRQVSFLQCYFVLTTNAGASIFKTISQYAEDNEGSGEKLEDFRGQIRRGLLDDGFRPELLGRIDEVIPFQPLSRETREKIVKRKMATLVREVKVKHNVETTIGPKVLTYLIEDKANTQSDAGGAREDISRFNKEVIAEVAQFVNYNPQVRSILVDIVGEMVSENTSIRKGTARVVVREHLGSTLIRS